MDSQDMHSEGNNSPIREEGGNNIKFYAILVAVAVIIGVIVLAWALTREDEENNDLYSPIIDPITLQEKGVLFLPDDVRLRFIFGETNFYANDARVLNDCSLYLDDWWKWEDDGEKFGYYRYVSPITLIGNVTIIDLEKIESIVTGTSPSINQ